jgi:ribosome-binding protein aMBF1 (putative translation factor)
MAQMQRPRLRSSRELLREELERDPELRRRWERTAPARAVALAVVGYRVQHGLSQRQLASLLGWKAAQVGRLELGEHNPSIETLWHLARALGLRFALAVSPAGQPIPLRRRKTDFVEEATADDGSRLLVAAGAS